MMRWLFCVAWRVKGGRALGTGDTDCHGRGAHWPRNDKGFYKGCGVRRGTWAPPYKVFCDIAGGQGRPPLHNYKSFGARPGGGAHGPRPTRAFGVKWRATARVAPTEALQEVRWGGRPRGSPLRRGYKKCGRRAVGDAGPYGGLQEVQWAGDRKGRPYGSVTRCAVRRADVGSESSAARGRRSERSEWPRSKFQATAVRQRRNFGHRNRVIGPYGENLGEQKEKARGYRSILLLLAEQKN